MATVAVLGLSFSLTRPLLTAFRIVPLLSTTASLTHAYMEWLTTSSFIHTIHDRSLANSSAAVEEMEKAKEQVVPRWFVNFFGTGVWSVIGLNTITLLSAIANLWVLPAGLGEDEIFYSVGLAAAVAHYAFVPLVVPSVNGLFKASAVQTKGDKAKGGEMIAMGNVKEWVSYHRVRMCTVDVVAWVSFVVGGIRVLSV
ncbi:hypothetical protein BKA66DRAFT_276976 [Pyrenochaeta sp. MPI-SDFR-AT-0127]|nr:hypothetical protein BKA66DRAFT_276976 [Pyrenochaeta sp. MPI-SDFR-AT-0127]